MRAQQELRLPPQLHISMVGIGVLQSLTERRKIEIKYFLKRSTAVSQILVRRKRHGDLFPVNGCDIFANEPDRILRQLFQLTG